MMKDFYGYEYRKEDSYGFESREVMEGYGYEDPYSEDDYWDSYFEYLENGLVPPSDFDCVDDEFDSEDEQYPLWMDHRK